MNISHTQSGVCGKDITHLRNCRHFLVLPESIRIVLYKSHTDWNSSSLHGIPSVADAVQF